MSVNDWLTANSISAEPFEVTVAGHVFRFKPLTNISLIAKAHERAKELMDIVNSGGLEAWAGYAPLAEQPAMAIAFMRASSLDVGDDALSDGLLLMMQANAGMMFSELVKGYEEKCGFGSTTVEASIEQAKNG